jgi:hypothetical protein
MDDQLKTIIESYTLNTYQVALISICVSVMTFLITNWLKNLFENKLLQRNLETEHKFEQQKKIKEAIAKYKVHLLTTCEDLSHRLWNLSNNHDRNWIKINGDYGGDHYYFHSTVYKFLCLYAWVGKVKKEMIYLDTTIASKEDLEFIKFLKFFPNVMCDLTFIVGKDADGDHAVDHFYRTNFELLPDYISDDDGPKSYADYITAIPNLKDKLDSLFIYLDGVSPNEKRMRWDRLHLLHLTTIIFLNNYGYDFQQTDDKKLEEVLTKPKTSSYTKNYFNLLREYKLGHNKEVKRVENIAKKHYVSERTERKCRT